MKRRVLAVSCLTPVALLLIVVSGARGDRLRNVELGAPLPQVETWG